MILNVTTVNRLLVLSFENKNYRTYFSKYYVPNVQIKDFIVLIDGKFFLTCKKIKKKHTNELSKWEETMITGNLLDYEYFSEHYKLVAIDLSKPIELENRDLKKQVNFIGQLKRNKGATMFFIIERVRRNNFLNFHKMLEPLFDFDYA